MPTLKISDFRGLLPKVDPRNLPAGNAKVANNVRFDAGDLSPIRRSEHEGYLSSDCGNLYYHHDDQEGADPRFIEFGSQFDVSFIRSPVPNDSHNRLFWNVFKDGVPEQDQDQYGLHAIVNPLSNPMPAFAASAVGTAGSPDYRQFQGYRLGIPAPSLPARLSDVTPPKVVEYGQVANISRTGSATVTLNVEVPFTDGMRVRFVINPDHPTGEEQPSEEPPEGEAQSTSTVGRIWSLQGQEGNVTDILESGSQTFSVIGVSGADLGEEPLTNEELQAIKIERVLNDSDMETRTYVFTYVSEFDEEGPPSPASQPITVPKVGSVVSIDLRDSSFRYSDHGGDRRNVNRVRVYRLATSDRNMVYKQVDDVQLEWNDPESHWLQTVTDSTEYVDTGKSLDSQRWYPPPPMMKGVKMMPGGFMVGWKGNTIYCSEPYLPHAWNPDYSYTTDDDILGVESYGSTMVIGTKGRPYIATATDPASVSPRKLDVFAPLLKPKAMVDAGSGVLYPSTTGLWMISQSGGKNMTEAHFDKKTWEQYLALLDRGIFHDGRIIFFSPGQTPLVLDMNGGRVELSKLDSEVEDHDYQAACIAGHDLIFVRRNGIRYDHMVRFKVSDPATTETLIWRSGLLTLPRASNMAVCQVFASGYPLTVHLAHADIQDGQPDLSNMTWRSYTVAGPEPFRLPSDYLSREFEIGVDSEHRVQMVAYASSMSELAAQ